jgi:hypothetical protein
MKRLNIKSLAICFSKASSLRAYQAGRIRTVIEAKQSRKRKGRNGNNTQDPEADYNVKIAADGKRKTTYGYKMHVNKIVTHGNKLCSSFVSFYSKVSCLG